MLELSPALEATPLEQADAIAQRLTQRKDAWVEVSIPTRIRYLQQCIESVLDVSQAWTEAACRAKGIDLNSNLVGEEWFVGPTATLAHLRSLIETLQAGGQPQIPITVRNGQAIAQAFPTTLMDRFLLPGFTGELWLQPGAPTSQGRIYREKSVGQVALVLGAGNISSIAPLDALHKLFAENVVVVLKMNPVNEYMGPILERALAPLRRDGFLEIVYGGAELGKHLCQHPLIDTIHITGSHHTHDAIVWGDLQEPSQRQSASPLNPKPITSELGCVTPVIVVPDRWSRSDLVFQAQHIAAMVAHNASFNCAAAKVVVIDKNWNQRQEFLDLVRQELAAIAPRYAYYPGAQQRYQSFLDRYPQAEPLGSRTESIVPWTFIPDVPPQVGELALTEEAFCGVLAEVSLDAIDTGDFLRQAVEFVNQQVWGNLSCILLVHPATQKQWAAELETAIAQLEYGAIAINAWSAVMFSLPMLSWGAFPGNSLADIQSGRGAVHNTYLFDYPQKSVLHVPFRLFPTPLWFSRQKNLLQIAQKYSQFQAKPGWGKLLGVAIAALRG